MKVYGPKDRFKVAIEGQGIAFILAPLTAKQKGEVLAGLSNRGGIQVKDSWEMVKQAIRYGVKAVEGFEDSEGKPLALALDADGNLTDEALDLLYNISEGQSVMIAAALQIGTASKFDAVLGDNGEPLEGVTIAHSGKV